MSRYLQTLKGKGKGSTDKIPLWRENPADVLRGTIKSSIMVKAQGVRGRVGLNQFPKFTEDLNYAQIYLFSSILCYPHHLSELGCF